MSDALIIFVRNPEWGAVKTRLAATVGNDKALAIYRQLLEHTRLVAEGVTADKYVFYAGSIPTSDMWEAAGFNRVLQSEGTLGEKMHAAFQFLFSRGYQRVIIIGSDCPDLTPGILTEGFARLKMNDAVIGPANDGGYYLLGIKHLHETLFAGKEWSTSSVCTATLSDLDKLGLTTFVLPSLMDIDTAEDWNERERRKQQAGTS